MTVLYVGVDVALSRPTDIVAVNADLEVKAYAQEDTPEAIAQCVADLGEAVGVAVDAPRRRNSGRMADPGFRSSLSPPPNKGRYQNCRLVEYELGRHGIPCYFTPRGELSNGQKWMQFGFDLYTELAKCGFTEFGNEETLSGRLMMEYFPHASFCALVGGYPEKKNTAEGRKLRADALMDCGVQPRDIACLTADGIDALVGAVTAEALANGRQRYVLGDEAEGFIVLPGPLAENCRAGD